MKRIPEPVSEVFHRLSVGAAIPSDLLATAFDGILQSRGDEQLRDLLLSAFLTGTMVRGPSVDDVVALLRKAFALDRFNPSRARAIPLPAGAALIGSVGSGKKGVKTINISTPAALTAASAGAYVAKPGSGSTSSVTGSADFMKMVGVNVGIPGAAMMGIVQELRFGFFEIEGVIPRFDQVYGGRFFAPHSLSFGLAALASPIRFDHMVYGLAHPNVELALKVLREFGVKNAIVVSCTHDDIHYLDEVGVYGTTRLIGMQEGRIGRLYIFDPTLVLALPRYRPQDIQQHPDAKHNVAHALRALQGKGPKAYRDIIAINAANLLFAAKLAANLKEGYELATAEMDSQRPLELLEAFVKKTNGDPSALKRLLK